MIHSFFVIKSLPKTLKINSLISNGDGLQFTMARTLVSLKWLMHNGKPNWIEHNATWCAMSNVRTIPPDFMVHLICNLYQIYIIYICHNRKFSVVFVTNQWQWGSWSIGSSLQNDNASRTVIMFKFGSKWMVRQADECEHAIKDNIF